MKKTSSVPCDICGHPMEMTHQGGRVHFDCTHGQQRWILYPDGSGNFAVGKNLWPHNMKVNSRMYRDKYLPALKEQQKHWAAMMLAAGYFSDQEHLLYLKDIDDFIADCYEKHRQNSLPRRIWGWLRGK